MRSFFKKPNWASSKQSSSEFYKLADTTYEDIVKAEERKKDATQKHEQHEVKTEAGPSTPRRDLKRRARDCSDTEDGQENIAITTPFEQSPGKLSPRKGSNAITTPIKQSPGKRSPTKATTRRDSQSAATPPSRFRSRTNSSAKKKPKLQYTPTPPRTADFANSIVIDSDSSDPGSPTIKPQRMLLSPPAVGFRPEFLAKIEAQAKPITISDEESPVEEEFPELRRRARERARIAAEERQRQEAEARAKVEAARTSSGPQTPSKQQDRPAGTQNTPYNDTERKVEILITSEIPGTKPLLVLRKLSQDLKEVRRYWCSRQQFTPAKAATVFLTWKGKRVFDVTTCQSLGIDTLEDDEDPFDDSSHDSNNYKVHMEAFTEELFEEQKSLEQAAERADDGDEEDNSEEPEKLVRIILQGPDMEDLRMRVRPETVIANIAQAVRTARNIPTDKTIHILFDGDRLDPGLAVADSEMDDMDRVDVLIK